MKLDLLAENESVFFHSALSHKPVSKSSELYNDGEMNLEDHLQYTIKNENFSGVDSMTTGYDKIFKDSELYVKDICVDEGITPSSSPIRVMFESNQDENARIIDITITDEFENTERRLSEKDSVDQIDSDESVLTIGVEGDLKDLSSKETVKIESCNGSGSGSGTEGEEHIVEISSEIENLANPSSVSAREELKNEPEKPASTDRDLISELVEPENNSITNDSLVFGSEELNNEADKPASADRDFTSEFLESKNNSITNDSSVSTREELNNEAEKPASTELVEPKNNRITNDSSVSGSEELSNEAVKPESTDRDHILKSIEPKNISITNDSSVSGSEELNNEAEKPASADRDLISELEELKNSSITNDSSVFSREELNNDVEKPASTDRDLISELEEPKNNTITNNLSYNSNVESGSITFNFNSLVPVSNEKIECLDNGAVRDRISKSESGKLSKAEDAVPGQIQIGIGESSFSSITPLASLINYSGPVSYSGNLSIRSDSSTTSTRSFAFPILQNDWHHNSPVRMAEADRRRFFRKHKGWRHGLFCCRF